MKLISGHKINMLTYLHDDGNKILPSGQKPKLVKVRCDCGTEKSVLKLHFVRGIIISCGCFIDPNRKENVVGKKYNRLLVTEDNGYVTLKGRKLRQVTCICDCGKTIKCLLYNLRTQKSCGCILKECSNLTTHGLSKTPLFGIYWNMRNRCSNKNVESYIYYGERNIKVCNEWVNDFSKFYDWAINNNYKKGLQIDRIDVNGDYCPENCRFVTVTVNQNNKRSNKFISYNGKTQSLSDWCRHLNLNYKRVHYLMKYKNMSLEEIIIKFDKLSLYDTN